ncbi:hypothetical protein [uncultured Friedmanniella sp.]
MAPHEGPIAVTVRHTQLVSTNFAHHGSDGDYFAAHVETDM